MGWSFKIGSTVYTVKLELKTTFLNKTIAALIYVFNLHGLSKCKDRTDK